MYGKNESASPFNATGDILLVNEVFYTIQGEGPDAGRPAIFVRLSKCNLRCYFCDTEFESGVERDVLDLVTAISVIARANKCNLVVVTGGEPLLQNIVPLTLNLNNLGISVSVETAGTVFYEGLKTVFDPMRAIAGNIIVCSPKTPRLAAGIEEVIGAYKYIIRHGHTHAGLPVMSTQIPDLAAPPFRSMTPSVPVFVQPMDEGDADKNAWNMDEAVRSSMTYGYRLSVQMHKIARVP